MPVPAHQRANHERTDDALFAVYGLSAALNILRHDCPNPEPVSDHAQAQDTVFRLLREKVQEIERLRRLEWVGIGGNSDLTADEMAQALGEQTAGLKT